MGLQSVFAEWGVLGEPAEPLLSVQQMMEEALDVLSCSPSLDHLHVAALPGALNPPALAGLLL